METLLAVGSAVCICLAWMLMCVVAADLTARKLRHVRHSNSLVGLTCRMVLPLGCLMGALAR